MPWGAGLRKQIEAGFVGEVLSCHADGRRDVSLGANPLTIANGHVIDALRFVVGNFSRVSCMVTT